jgi:hypothetical protein
LVTYTSSSLYWSPLKPRIRIYALSDSSYSSALYTYNAFTDVGTNTKPISLNFDSETTNVGTFSIEIEDTDYELDPDTFMRGNRVFIECSKDGSTWQPAFKGLVRSSDQNIYATTGRNFAINGYSYLIRLNERVLNTIKESSLTGSDYNRTDSNMFTDNLINDLLTTNSNYVYSDDDTALYSIFKKTNITSSPITDWIPRLDAQLVTVNDAINSVLEFSNGLVMLNPADDELVLYNPDLVTSATSIFLLTNQMNQSADDADYTMYPLEPYRYNISYDYPDSGSRLIGSIGEILSEPGEQCPEEPPIYSDSLFDVYPASEDLGFTFNRQLASYFTAGASQPIRGITASIHCRNNCSGVSSIRAHILNSAQTSQVGPYMTLYRNGVSGTAFPSSATNVIVVQQEIDDDTGPSLTPGTRYWMVLAYNHATADMGWVANYDWVAVTNATGTHPAFRFSNDGGGSWSGVSTSDFSESGVFFRFEFAFGGSPACGGGGGGSTNQATKDADPVFAVAHDRNMSGRIGVVERVMSAIPTHIKTRQTLNEYLYNKLYFAAKPRFTFDFPSVTMPNKIPKAGDIITHVDTKARVGTQTTPVQTGVVSSIQYSFEQGKGQDDALGLRRLSLSTTGIKRGSY